MDPITGLILGGLSAVGSVVSNIFGANSAKQQQDFQAQEYATRYQTQMKDMQAAGLNPMLSYMQSPGSAPSGTSFTPSNVGAAAAEGYATGSSAETTNALRNVQVANMQADTVLKASSSKAAMAQTEQALANAKLANANSAVTAATLPYVAEKASADAALSMGNARKAGADVPRAVNEQHFYESAAGKVAQNVGLFIKNATGGGNSATALDAIPTIGRMIIPPP